ncbi:hypothetical protein [Ancylobacter defluvii]|uniref:Uncharacterized protein n=1 Tax=Ancylobacter defluvii TaxID=1282440 RepID=A0A9W6K045_9HYPH|nr:hypothetical protein [Ancylobacter defluvii]MBS7586417.1 hypothetical protein [Ancylobacter defluvii]GLK85698.1 hypothetical protein GCM10017653_37680 [Ancylobacter defluvii]
MDSGRRLACCVPFCRRTRGVRKGETGLPSEWICGPHWAGVPRALKRRKSLNFRFIRREMRRQPLASQWWRLPPGSAERIKAIGMWRVAGAIWDRCKRAAIEAAGGIA